MQKLDRKSVLLKYRCPLNYKQKIQFLLGHPVCSAVHEHELNLRPEAAFRVNKMSQGLGFRKSDSKPQNITSQNVSQILAFNKYNSFWVTLHMHSRPEAAFRVNKTSHGLGFHGLLVFHLSVDYWKINRNLSLSPTVYISGQ